LFAAPLAFGAVQAWAWASLAALACVLLFLWSVGCVRQGALKIVGSPLYLPGVLFLLLGTIQLFAHLTLDPIATRESLLKLVTDLVFFFLAGQLLATGSPRILRAFGLAVVVYAFSLALFAILQFFSSKGLIFWTVAAPGAGIFGPYVNRNHYAGLMEMLIPLAAGYVLSRPRDHPLRLARRIHLPAGGGSDSGRDFSLARPGARPTTLGSRRRTGDDSGRIALFLDGPWRDLAAPGNGRVHHEFT
jgi:hypothetical protein